MIQSRNALIIALLFPIFALGALTAYKKYILSTGQEVILPISGYDPRDLLSGHYLIYQIDYGVDRICPEGRNQQTGYICLDPRVFSYTPFAGCRQFIRGVCDTNGFEAGVEKYFVPQDKALVLERQIQSKKASIVLSVPSSGQAQVKDLLIEGVSWQNQRD